MRSTDARASAGPAVAIYAALSRKKAKTGDDDRSDEESVESQIANVRQRLHELYGDDVTILGIFDEVGHSGSKRNRGPQLEAAIRNVTKAADEFETVELWANTSARFARGTGKRDEARAVGELFYDLRRRGVALRTVRDDEFVTNEMLVGFASAQAAKYAADLSESVTRSKRRQAQRGEHLGGPLPIGYVKDDGIVIGPEHAPTVERIFELASQGVPDSQIARTVNSEGHRSRAGRPFDRRAIQAIVTNAFYAGRVVYEGEMFDGKHDALISPETFDTIQSQRAGRDLGRGHHTAGAPARLHLLSRLGTCAECSSPMYSRTSPYRRKDGTKARVYACRSYVNADGTCDAEPVDAEAVDLAVMERLHDLIPDFARWISSIEDRHAEERHRLGGLVERARADVDQTEADLRRHERRYRDLVARDDPNSDLALEFVAEARQNLQDAQTRLQATEDAEAAVPTEAPRDALLDFAIDLRNAIAGKVAGAHSVEDVNRVLVAYFDTFAISRGDWLPADEGLHAPGISIEPVLRPEVAAALVHEHWPNPVPTPTPPMAWIGALGNSVDSHPSTESRQVRLALPPIAVPETGYMGRPIPAPPRRSPRRPATAAEWAMPNHTITKDIKEVR